ncbi:hypothetical protein ABEB36_008346 [Hypothenemus hampei]|uniref:Nuclear migration protein nudC n=1 Tax=Hypothenemus hampei TaxID=57062 RepID=A0ABD1EM39_HYPHA
MTESVSVVHDDLLFNLLKECKTLPVFLDHIFGFLQRRTDFYHLAKDPNSPIGLPAGLAESLVKSAYFKWIPKKSSDIQVFGEDEIPEAVREEVVITEEVIKETSDHVENISLEKEQQRASKITMNQVFSKSESYNGAVYGNYCWSQTIKEVDIVVKLPENFNSKELEVVILPQSISIKIKNEVILNGELCEKCKYTEALWSVDKQKLQIHLDKCKEFWWNYLVKTESQLDLSQIDCSRPFEDLPEDAQVKIEELGWNQERKKLGLPTSDEMARQEMLRKAWNAEGSPFSGPFDPSQVVFH